MAYTIKQNISAGSQFDGSEPSTTPVITNGVKEYPADTQGGQFVFDDVPDGPVAIVEVLIKFGAQTNWELAVEDPTVDLSLVSGTTETTFIYHPTNDLILLPGQKLKLITVGASQVMWAAVLYSPAEIGEM